MNTQPATPGPNGVAPGNGCIYPPVYKTIGDEMTAAGLAWKAYAENIPAPCSPVHDAPGSYERKHDAFPYFQSGVQDGDCAANNVSLDQLPAALQSASTTANVNYIFPNECDDGHSDCTGSANVAAIPEIGSEADEMAQYDAFLQKYVPMITSSPAFKDGMLVITFDEGDDPFGCCGEPMQDPDGSYPGGEDGSPGGGGGQVGAVAISPFITPGHARATTSTTTTRCSRAIEDLFGVPRLAEAQLRERRRSGRTSTRTQPASALSAGPRRCRAHRARAPLSRARGRLPCTCAGPAGDPVARDQRHREPGAHRARAGEHVGVLAAPVAVDRHARGPARTAERAKVLAGARHRPPRPGRPPAIAIEAWVAVPRHGPRWMQPTDWMPEVLPRAWESGSGTKRPAWSPSSAGRFRWTSRDPGRRRRTSWSTGTRSPRETPYPRSPEPGPGGRVRSGRRRPSSCLRGCPRVSRTDPPPGRGWRSGRPPRGS